MEFKVVMSKREDGQFVTSANTKIYIDGELVKYAVGYSISQEPNSIQKVTIDFIPTSVVLENT